MTQVHRVATRLDEAARSATAVPQPSTEGDSLSLDQAYEVQHAGLALRADRGDRIIGVKLGFTSKAKAAQMGVSDVIVGELTTAMGCPDGGRLDHHTAISRPLGPAPAPS